LSAYLLQGNAESSEGDKDFDVGVNHLQYSGISNNDLTNMSVENIYKKMEKNVAVHNDNFIENLAN